MTDDAVEVDPFSFVNLGSADKDFTPVIEQVDGNEPQELELPKDSVHLRLTSSSDERSGSPEQPAPEALPPTDSNPMSSDPMENPEETNTESLFRLPDTPPIPSFPSVAKTTPPAS